MKIFRYTITAIVLSAAVFGITAQDNSQASSVRRRTDNDRNQQNSASVTERMQGFYESDNASLSEADIQWLRIIYRQLDLEKDKNATLYFPEETIDGQENLFRIIMRLLANNELSVYEYLDGREIFNDTYKVNVKDMLDRFHILYEPARGSSDKNPKFTINESDVPTNEVLSYYIIEHWTYDTRNNRLRPTVEAICPVLHRAGDFGGEPVRYPMFWIKYNDLRPHLSQQAIFIDDSNNLPTCTYDDFFTLNMYEGEIYKTRNLKNLSMAQMYPDPEDRKRAQDSIQAALDSFEQRLWTPTREELLERAEAADANDSTEVSADNQSEESQPVRSTRRSSRRPAKVKEPAPSNSQSTAAPVRSVRRRR